MPEGVLLSSENVPVGARVAGSMLRQRLVARVADPHGAWAGRRPRPGPARRPTGISADDLVRLWVDHADVVRLDGVEAAA